MVNAYRVRVGSDPKFFPATDEKKAVAFADLVEDNWVRDPATGEFSHAEPTWYRGTFEGRDAEVLHQHFRKGDPLVVAGNDEFKIREVEKDGETKVYENRHLYVKTFGPDASMTHARIDRAAVEADKAQRAERRHAQQHGQAPQQSQGQQQWVAGQGDAPNFSQPQQQQHHAYQPPAGQQSYAPQQMQHGYSQ